MTLTLSDIYFFPSFSSSPSCFTLWSMCLIRNLQTKLSLTKRQRSRKILVIIIVLTSQARFSPSAHYLQTQCLSRTLLPSLSAPAPDPACSRGQRLAGRPTPDSVSSAHHWAHGPPHLLLAETRKTLDKNKKGRVTDNRSGEGTERSLSCFTMNATNHSYLVLLVLQQQSCCTPLNDNIVKDKKKRRFINLLNTC